tara:strand:+ start:1296 stop:1649 length:354 start_codon:yes stop_codon:yes gene_type:complete
MPPSIGNSGGGGIPGGGGGGPCAAHTKLINTNKIEANILLFCIIIRSQMYRKKSLNNIHETYFYKKTSIKRIKSSMKRRIIFYNTFIKTYLMVKNYVCLKKVIPQIFHYPTNIKNYS